MTKGEVQYQIEPISKVDLPAYMGYVVKDFGKGWYYFRIKLRSNKKWRLMYFCAQSPEPEISALATFIIRMRGVSLAAYREWMKRLRELLPPESIKKLRGTGKEIRKEIDTWVAMKVTREIKVKNELDTEWSRWT